MTQRLFVTGLSGFVGKHLQAYLAAAHTPWALLPVPHRYDLLEPDSLGDLWPELPDAVIHLAGQTYVPEAFRDPARTLQINLLGTLNLLQALKARGFSGTFLYISSRKHETALRIGLNHGSLGKRITDLYGNTPVGMKEAAMEWLRMCRDLDFGQVVVSLKASNTLVMLEAYRLLAAAMEQEDFHFPLHLGVTEAGNGESGRIKSCVAISTLLEEGLGDTIRVSLTEDPAAELPVARYLSRRYSGTLSAASSLTQCYSDTLPAASSLTQC